MRVRPTLIVFLLTTIFSVGEDQKGAAEELSSIRLDKDDEVCFRIYGSVKTIQSCLIRALSEIEEDLQGRIDIIRDTFSNSDNYEELLEKSQQIWTQRKELMCDDLIWKDKPGSRRRTEPIRCEYYITDARKTVLAALHSVLSGNLLSGRLSKFHGTQQICWNPYGWYEELDCLQTKNKKSRKQLMDTIHHIYGNDYRKSDKERDEIFRRVRALWKEEVSITCTKLMPSFKNLKKLELKNEFISWCKFFMRRTEERFLKRVYQFRLHQKGIDVFR